MTKDRTTSAADSLEAMRANYETLFRDSRNIFAHMSGPDHVFVYVNPGHVQLLGRDVTGLAARVAQPEAAASGVFEILDEVYRTGIAQSFRERPVVVGAETRYVDFIYSPTRSAKGQVDGVMALATDVTDAFKAQATMRNQNAWLEEVLNRLPLGLVMVEPATGKYRFSNLAARELLGQAPPPETLLDLAPDRLVVRNLEGKALSQSEIPSARAARGEELSNETIILDRGRSRRYVSCNSNTIPALAGHPETVLVPFLDITDLKAKELELVNNIKKLDTIVHDLTEGLVFSDPEGEIQLMNPAALRIHGFETLAAMIGSLRDYKGTFEIYEMDGTHLALEQWPMARVLRGERFADYEVELRQGDRRTIINYGGTPVLDGEGKLILGVLLVRDVTPQKLAERDLRDAVRARDEFLSLASHELKTPLTSLKLQTQMFNRAVERGNPDAYSKERVDLLSSRFTKQLSRLERLIDDMLDISRIRSGKLALQPETSDLAEIAKDLLQRMEDHFTESEVPVPVLEVKTSALGLWDRFRVEQVLTNLLTNAIRYGKRSQIEVTVESDAKSARVTVRDRGLGIALKDQRKIFERFERVSNASEVSGLGLGLFIAHQIARAHGGQILLESEEGKGSAFTLELPLAGPGVSA